MNTSIMFIYMKKRNSFFYKTLKNIKNPTLSRVSKTIRNFQTILIKEQEISHAKAPRGKSFCLNTPHSLIPLNKRKKI